MQEEMSLEQLEALEKNPHYKLSQKQQALLDKYRMQVYKPLKKHNYNFKKETGKVDKNIQEE